MKFKLLIKNKFISTIIGTLSLFLGVAFILPLNNFSVYITSYIHLKYSNITMHYGLFINIFFMFPNTLSISLGGYLENLFGFYKTMIIGFLILFIANFAFIFQQNIWLCYFLAFLMGIGSGIGTSLVGKNLTLYAPNKKGIISGVMGIGIMFITAMFALIGEKIINWDGYTLKENEDYYPDEYANRTYIFFLIGECFIPIGLILALLLIYEYKPEENQDNKEKEQNEKKDVIEQNEDEKQEKNEDKNKEEEKNEDKVIKPINEKTEDNTEENEKDKELKKQILKKKIIQAIKNLRFWRLSFISFFFNISISFMINTGRTFGALIGINGNALQFAGILQVLFVLLLAPPLGIVVDKKGPLLILRISVIITIIPGILLLFFMENDFVFISCFVLYVLCIVSLMVSSSPLIMEIYGIQESVILGGIMNGFTKISDIIVIVSAFAFSLVCETNKDCLKDRYRIMYLISSICCAISALLLFFEKKDKFNYEIIPSEEFLINNENEKLEISPDENIKNEINEN